MSKLKRSVREKVLHSERDAGHGIAGIQEDETGHNARGHIAEQKQEAGRLEEDVVLVDESGEGGETAAEAHSEEQAYMRRQQSRRFAAVEDTVKQADKEASYYVDGEGAPRKYHGVRYR